MTVEKLCLLLKTMQYIVVIAHKKQICDDICPMRCQYRPVYGGHSPGHSPGHSYGHTYQNNAYDVDIESLARALGVPKDTFSDLMSFQNQSVAMTPPPPRRKPGNKERKILRTSSTPVEKDAVQFIDKGVFVNSTDGKWFFFLSNIF